MGGDRRNFRLSKDVLPSRYDLRFELEFDTWTSTGSERISLRSARLSREITLHAIELEILGATIDGANKIADIQTDAESETATLRFASDIPAGEHVLPLAGSAAGHGAGGLQPAPRSSHLPPTQTNYCNAISRRRPM